MIYHQPVLVAEILKIFSPVSGAIVLDGTIGHGGHSLALLQAGCPRVYGLDQDPQSLKIAKNRIEKAGFLPRITLAHTNFTSLESFIRQSNPPINCILLDLGLNSHQQKEGAQGFSFQTDQPLDMRLNPRGPTASDFLSTVSEDELSSYLSRLVQHPLSPILAKELVAYRRQHPLLTTRHLADFMVNFYSSHRLPHSTHPATKIFLMLRLIVNHELENLTTALQIVGRVALPGTKVAIITFHSTEDRLVKLYIQQNYPGSPAPIKPAFSEIKANPLARSAMLRWFATPCQKSP